MNSVYLVPLDLCQVSGGCWSRSQLPWRQVHPWTCCQLIACVWEHLGVLWLAQGYLGVLAAPPRPQHLMTPPDQSPTSLGLSSNPPNLTTSRNHHMISGRPGGQNQTTDRRHTRARNQVRLKSCRYASPELMVASGDVGSGGTGPRFWAHMVAVLTDLRLDFTADRTC